MPEEPLVLSPLTKFRFEVALHEKRIRRADYTRYLLGIVLNDGTMLKLASEHEAIIALRCLTSGAHAGRSPLDARAAEREAASRVTGART